MEELASALARRMGLSVIDIAAVREAALLHDIGLYRMQPQYIGHQGPLSLKEQMDLWRHPIIGEQEMAKRGASRHAQLLVRWHHEWWNGTGYPDKLSFEDIPIGARILRAVELYCALKSDRPYREALSEIDARHELASSAGIECDPYVVSSLLIVLIETVPLEPEPVAAHEPNQDAASEVPEFELRIDREALEKARARDPLATAPLEPTDKTSQFGEDSVGSEQVQPETNPESAPPFGSPEHTPDSGIPSTAIEFPEPVNPPIINNVEIIEVEAPAGPEAPLNSEQKSISEPVQHEPTVEPSIPEDRSAEVHSSASRAEYSAPDSPPAIEPESQEHAPSEPAIQREPSVGAQEPVRQTPPAAALLRGWTSSASNTKSILGFQASVLRQVEFRSVAIPICGWADLVWYLKIWGKQIFSNDPRAWAAAVSRSVIESGEKLSEERVTDLLADVYVPSTGLSNPGLRRWFGEADACFMDNLRSRVEHWADHHARDEALLLGLRTGDYAQSFGPETGHLKHPLTYIFRRLAAGGTASQAGHPYNRSFHMPIEDFTRAVRADLMYLTLPAGQAESPERIARSRWREAWISQTDNIEDDAVTKLVTAAQSKQSYLDMVDRILATSANTKKWAIECRDVGLASAEDITDLIKTHRSVRATYSKDLSEVAGGLRNYIIIAEAN